MALENIEFTNWFKTLEMYPKTVSEFSLLVKMVDRIGIFHDHDVTPIRCMDAEKLDIIYVVLKITNKIFNNYLSHVVENVFVYNLCEIFKCSDLIYHEMFIEQLTQDVDDFVCTSIQNYFQKSNSPEIIEETLISHLKQIFSQPFYLNIFDKLGYNCDSHFYEENRAVITEIINEYLDYTNTELTETYTTMKYFIDMVFDSDSDPSKIQEIIATLENLIDVHELLTGDSSLEFDAYCEHLSND